MFRSLRARRALIPFLILLAIAATALATLATHPPQARASTEQVSIMMDDDLLVYRTDEVRDQALRQMKSLGVDVARVTVLWSVVAENARSTPARKRRFKAEDPRTYPARNWDRFDRLVRAARTLGIGVYFNVTGPGPDWAHKRTKLKRNQRAWKPKTREFYKFVAALAKRYSGTYRDENDGRLPLPRVVFWSLWNEPNQGGWLLPQWEFNKTAGRVIPTSPILFRELYFFGRKALQDNGHGSDIILLGETAPLGSGKRNARSPMWPKPFVRELFCVDPNGRPYTGKAAAARRCSMFDKFGPIVATAFAHHPYTKNVAPTVRDRSPDAVTMANIGELPALLDQIAATTGRLASGLPLFLTEFGFETNPPDRYSGIDPAKQAEYLNVGDFLAWANPRIAGQTQFLLRDVEPLRRFRRGSKAYWFTYQSGLYTIRGQQKPSVQAYMLPFLLYPSSPDPATGGRRLHIWAQLRFRPNGVTTDTADVQFRAQGSTTWQAVATLPADVRGYLQGDVVVPGPGTWRIAWQGGQLPFQATSREIPVLQ